MWSRIRELFAQTSLRRMFYAFWIAVTGAFTLIFFVMGQHAAAIVALVFGLGVMAVFACRFSSALYAVNLQKMDWRKWLCILLAAGLTCWLAVAPMGQGDLWNGERPDHRNQYEKLAEAFLEGHLYIEYGGEEELAKLENPYDPKERQEAGVWYAWDHAFYNGHYYMYFGVVPVLLVFLPYLAITGESLTTYYATALFAVMIVAGLFALFYLLAKRFFPQLPLVVYLMLSVGFSLMSVWFASAEPALYCTAIASAVAMEVWSLFFFVKAVYATKSENKAIGFAAVGALFGALAFGCRPTIALANLLVIPLLVTFLRNRKFSLPLLGKLVLAALPYVIVAAGLMWYNAARFDDPLEFGQAYQLTVADQTEYGGISFEATELARIFNETVRNFFYYSNVGTEFPYLNHSGLFFNFPILFLMVVGFLPAVRQTLRRQKLSWVAATAAASLVVITLFQVVWTPYLLERYRMDLYFLAGILCFLLVGIWCVKCPDRSLRRRSVVLLLLGGGTALSAILLCLRQINVYYPDFVNQVKDAVGIFK